MTFNEYKEKILEDPRSIKLGFDQDGRNHYVYRVSHKHIKIHYYGSKTEKIETIGDTIGCGYYTSSDYLKNDFKENIEDYKVKIVRRFNNPGDKILFESYIHNYFNVKSRYNFINKSNQTPWGFTTYGQQLGSKHPRAKSVLKIDRYTGEILEEFDTVSQAQKNITKGNISMVIRGVQFSAGGYAWCYKENYTKELVQKIIDRSYNYTEAIYQLDKHTGQIIKVFDNMENAQNFIESGSIWSAVNGSIPSAGGYAWCKVKDYSPKLIEKIVNRTYDRKGIHNARSKAVYKMDKDTGNILEEYVSITAAQLSIKKGSVERALYSINKISGGFMWEYKTDLIPVKAKEAQDVESI